ncbi:enoyl-CoA hydratase-related protein [Nocardia callitridis]|uniref:Enoyl-CoA hydratase-related protein n=1 Tax=Nocardia callitridis TaxID=648753 RepID=A0ABP9KS40_9NOCA
MAEFVTTELLTDDVDDAVRRVAVLRLSRPPMNLVTAQVVRELADAAEALAANSEVAAVVLYGDERVFSAGDEMTELAELGAAQAEAIAEDLRLGLDCLARLPQPTVAAISGYCLGGGLELALGADRRIIGDNVKLGMPQILAGLIPLSGIPRLVSLIGPGAAKDLVYTGRFVEADEAEALGLVDEVVAPDDVYTAAVAWARQFTGGPAVALAAAKAVFEAQSASEAGTRAGGRAQWSRLFGTEDRAIGTRSYRADGPGAAAFVGR